MSGIWLGLNTWSKDSVNFYRGNEKWQKPKEVNPRRHKLNKTTTPCRVHKKEDLVRLILKKKTIRDIARACFDFVDRDTFTYKG